MLELIKKTNFIIVIDSYKFGHNGQLPEGVVRTASLTVPRKANEHTDDIVALGHMVVANTLAKTIIDDEMIDEAEIEANEQGYEFNREGWEVIRDEYGGRIPVIMMGVEEGRVVKPQTPIAGIINATEDVRLAWLPAYIETYKQSVLWKMTTVASIARFCKKLIKKYMIITDADLAMLDYMIHNFGDRGADGPEAGVYAGIGHAAVFGGSDCVRANPYIKVLYNTKKPYTSSVDATEHSTMCANSNADTLDDEGAADMVMKRIHKAVKRVKEKGIGLPIVSSVIDTYNSRRWVQKFVRKYKDELIASGGKWVQRPDSGDPTVEPGMVAKDLEDVFGCTTNAKGFKVLPPYVGVLQGDGITADSLEGVIKGWIEAGYSLSGILFGMGGGITHEAGRDEFSFSVKGVALQWADKTWKRLLKQPNTDLTKKSLSGLVRCEEIDGELKVFEVQSFEEFIRESKGWVTWYNGLTGQVRQENFDDVKTRASWGI